MRNFLDNARSSLRLLRRHKGFATLAILSLGVAIALNTTMYSVLDTMIAPRIAMHEPERLYAFIYYGDFRNKIPQSEKFEAFRSLASAVAVTGSIASGLADRFIQRGADLREARVLTVLPNYFQALGVQPSAGRLLGPADLDALTRPVVVSERIWKSLFSDKASFEVTTLTVGGEPRMVIGVLPFEADFPGDGTDVWQLPLSQDVSRIAPSLMRLRANITPAQASAELEVLRDRFAEVTGEHNAGDSGFRFFPATTRPYRAWKFHYALVGSVVAVLLIACANLANLQLARGVARARELATRTAVGATRRHIIMQLLAESAWLAIGGLAIGAVLTVWGMKLVDANVPPQVAEYMTHTQISWRVLVFAVGATSVCLVLMGLAPAIRVSRVDVNELLKAGAGTGRTVSARRQYGTLVVVEIALALALLCSASLLIRSAASVITFEPGFDQRGVLSTFMTVAARDSRDTRTRLDWANQLVSEAVAIPGITHAAISMTASPRTRSIATEDADGGIREHPASPPFSYQVVTADYLRTLRLQVVKGRDFSVNEFAEPSVIVDEATASFLWPGIEPVGRMVKLDSAHTISPWMRVVGVARRQNTWYRRASEPNTARTRGLGSVYVLAANDTVLVMPRARGRPYTTFFSMSVRTDGDLIKAAIALRQAMLDEGAGYVQFPRTWEQSSGIAGLRAKHGFMATLFAVFSSMALALAALGVYAIIAHMVAQRTREFGVRMAVGAGMRDIRELVLREGNVLALAGIAIGLLITAYSAGWLRAFVFDDYDRYDSRVYAVAALALFGTAWLASYIPARRAMKINPVEALRND